MAKKIPKASSLLPVSSIPHASFHFWFSDDITDWICSNKNTQALRRKRVEVNDFREHENNIKAYKRKHG